MKYDLVRPCPNCPFRCDIDGYLRGERVREITTGIAEGGGFPCHQTTETVETDEGTDRAVTEDSQFCAGALIFLEKQEAPNQIMRIAERLHVYDASKLDMDSPVFSSALAMQDHHEPYEDEGDCCSIADHGCLAPAGMLVGGVAVRAEREGEATECPGGCGQYVCENCAWDGGRCPDCAEALAT